MVNKTLFIVVLFCVSAATASRTKPRLISDGEVPNDGVCKTMAETQGYICHEHTVTTQDGYILSIQRIPTTRSGKTADKPPVLLQHGLILDGMTWLLNPPNQSLAFILADNGYDVWIANTRGTKYSRRHTSIAPNDQVYWEWSWDELVAYDLPASVKFVKDQTGKKLHYVGHSLGTLIAFAAFSQEKLLNMIRSAALLSPIAHLGHMPSPLLRTAVDAYLPEDLYFLGLHEFLDGWEPVVILLKGICERQLDNCPNLINAITGPNCCLNSSILKVFLENEPQATSTKNMVHLSQMVRKGTMTMYDYGNEVENMNHYRQATPPVYNVKKIPNDFPLFVSYGGKDLLSDVKDVKLLLDDLKDHKGDKMTVQYIEDYAHADFILGMNANKVVYDSIMAFFQLH